MIPCERYAHFTLARDASLFGVAAVMLMIGFSFEPALALDLGATVALVFAMVQIIRYARLTEARFRQGEVWQSLRTDERPAGAYGVRLAHAAMRHQMLRFAKKGSGTAIVMYSSGLVLAELVGINGL